MLWRRASSHASSAGASGNVSTKPARKARRDVFDCIEMVRKHIRNEMRSPAEFERQQILNAQGV